jgi:hypothetical protein
MVEVLEDTEPSVEDPIEEILVEIPTLCRRGDVVSNPRVYPRGSLPLLIH